MRSLSTALVCLAVLMFACEQPEETEVSVTAKKPRPTAAPSIAPSMPAENSLPPMQLATSSGDALADQFPEIPDEELPDLMDAVASKEDPALRRALLTTIFEESDLRPPPIRLPLLLEIARSKDANPDLRATIMGELGATLQTDHGASWADWSLAIEEHLANKHGIIRVE